LIAQNCVSYYPVPKLYYNDRYIGSFPCSRVCSFLCVLVQQKTSNKKNSVSVGLIGRPRPLRRRHSHVYQSSGRETDFAVPPEDTVSIVSDDPPRFGSVVRRNAPHYSTLVRPTHSTITPVHAIQFDGVDAPPAYSEACL
jgi:hypothetical protein